MTPAQKCRAAATGSHAQRCADGRSLYDSDKVADKCAAAARRGVTSLRVTVEVPCGLFDDERANFIAGYLSRAEEDGFEVVERSDRYADVNEDVTLSWISSFAKTAE